MQQTMKTASSDEARPGLMLHSGLKGYDKGILVTPAPKIRTLEPSYDTRGVLILGL